MHLNFWEKFYNCNKTAKKHHKNFLNSKEEHIFLHTLTQKPKTVEIWKHTHGVRMIPELFVFKLCTVLIQKCAALWWTKMKMTPVMHISLPLPRCCTRSIYVVPPSKWIPHTLRSTEDPVTIIASLVTDTTMNLCRPEPAGQLEVRG